jgi:hypothetical protein
MEWFYATGTDQKGPVEQVELERLVQAGVITRSTLVWREGMTDWKPYDEVANATIGSGQGEVVCSECGRLFGRDETIRLGSGFVCANCKPLAMQKLREGATNSTSEQIRQEHIKHEASVKSIGTLYFLGSAFLLLMSLVGLVGLVSESGRSRDATGSAVGGVMFVLFFGIGVVQIVTGFGLRRLRPWARIPAGILSGLGLLAFPVGTLINGYILYLLFSQKGAMVFSEGYQRIIEETPHVKYRTPVLVWVLLILIVCVVVGGCLFVGLKSR